MNDDVLYLPATSELLVSLIQISNSIRANRLVFIYIGSRLF